MQGVVSCVVLLLPLVVGQAAEQPSKKDLANLRGFLGTWESTDIEFDGRNIQGTTCWRPFLNGHFIEQKWTTHDASGKLAETGLMLIGTDPSDQRTKFWAFLSDGCYAHGTLDECDGTKVRLTTEELRAGGAKRSGRISLDLEDKDTYRWEIVYEDGKKGSGVFKRTKQKKAAWPQPTSKMPEGVDEPMKDLAWWAGACTTEGTDAFTGKTSVGQSRCGWTLGGKFLLYDLAFVESDLAAGRYRAIVGVDPSTNVPTGWEFDSAGTVGKYTVSDKGQDITGKAISPIAGVLDFKGRMAQTETGFEYRATGKLPTGKETSYYGVWKKRPDGE